MTKTLLDLAREAVRLRTVMDDCLAVEYHDASNKFFEAYRQFEKEATPKRIIELCEALKECADDLEGMIKAHYEGGLDYPTEKRRYDRDMEPVIRARRALNGE